MEYSTAIAIAISLGAMCFSGWAAFSTWRQARFVAAQTVVQSDQLALLRDQLKLQQELALQASQPYVWADIQPDTKQGSLLDLVVGNEGPTVAKNVRVRFDSPLPASEDWLERIEDLRQTLAEGLHSIAPGRKIRWTLGTSPDLMAEDLPQLLTISVDAQGPAGDLPTLVVPVDFSQWRQSKDAPDGSLHYVRSAIQDLNRTVEKIASSSSKR